MRLLNKIDANADQKFTVVGENQEIIPFRIYYVPSQFAWFFDLSYNGITVNGCKVSVSPNMLRNIKNRIPFGLACITNDGHEPYYLDDFKNDRIRLYLLNANEVQQIEESFGFG